MSSLNKLTIKGFKSIRALEDFELKNLNIIIGANGSGKSNLISFFRMLRDFIDGNLNRFAANNGGAGDILFNGRKVTKEMEFETRFDGQIFRFKLAPTPKDEFSVENEAGYLDDGNYGYSGDVCDVIRSWQIYHFHDTSSTSGMRHSEIVQDNEYLRESAENIGAFLLKLREEHKQQYNEIVNAIRLVAPFFDDFILKPAKKGEAEKVDISWRQKGSDFPMQPYHLSDGTIRFICLATALLQPDLPSTIIIDEPELGLHPEAIEVLAELIKAASKQTQVIVATQSPALINHFSIDDIVVVSRKDGQSVFERMKSEDFSVWLKDYSVGELWEQNIINGGSLKD